MTLKNKFLKSWQVFFGNPELPLAFYYSDERYRAERVQKKA